MVGPYRPIGDSVFNISILELLGELLVRFVLEILDWFVESIFRRLFRRKRK
ncbi:hypothetical protein D3C80_18080 [compost metagenome]